MLNKPATQALLFFGGVLIAAMAGAWAHGFFTGTYVCRVDQMQTRVIDLEKQQGRRP